MTRRFWLKDEENPMDLQRAKAISDVAQTIINSAKVEVEFLEIVGEGGGEFFETPEGVDVRRPSLIPPEERRLTRRTQ